MNLILNSHYIAFILKRKVFFNKNYFTIEFKFYYQKVNLNLDPVPEEDLVFFPGFGVSF